MKLCQRCGSSEFYDSGACKPCTRKAASESRLRRIDAVREYDRVRGRTDGHRAAVRSYAQTKNGREAHLKANREWRRRNRQKMAAHNAVAKALLKGTLQRQSCERCGEPKSEAHHDDYDKKLEVTWLCQVHHKQRHKELLAAAKVTAT